MKSLAKKLFAITLCFSAAATAMEEKGGLPDIGSAHWHRVFLDEPELFCGLCTRAAAPAEAIESYDNYGYVEPEAITGPAPHQAYILAAELIKGDLMSLDADVPAQIFHLINEGKKLSNPTKIILSKFGRWLRAEAFEAPEEDKVELAAIAHMKLLRELGRPARDWMALESEAPDPQSGLRLAMIFMNVILASDNKRPVLFTKLAHETATKADLSTKNGHAALLKLLQDTLNGSSNTAPQIKAEEIYAGF